jgi:hypothetical protein
MEDHLIQDYPAEYDERAVIFDHLCLERLFSITFAFATD